MTVLHVVSNIRSGLCLKNGQGMPECLVPTVKHTGRSVMIWAAISSYSAGPTITLNGWITYCDCVDILGNQVHPVVQMLFHNNSAIVKDDNWPTHTHTRSQKCSVLIWVPCRRTSTSSLATTITRLNLLKTKRRLLYIKNQSVPRCKHFPPRL